MMLRIAFILLTTMLLGVNSYGQSIPSDRILGRWTSVQGNLIIDVSKQQNEFKAVILWFRDPDSVGKRPMAERLDSKNPNPALRTKRIIGSNVLHGLKYSEKKSDWEGGVIYDATSGKEWQSIAWLTKDGKLKVRGYWKFEIFGHTLTFNRVRQ